MKAKPTESAGNQTRPGSPTGQVQNGLGAFEGAPGKAALFIFATLDGTISGWNPTVGDGKTAVIKVDNGGKGSYLGLGIGTSSAGPTLYAANFGTRRIDTFDCNTLRSCFRAASGIRICRWDFPRLTSSVSDANFT